MEMVGLDPVLDSTLTAAQLKDVLHVYTTYIM